MYVELGALTQINQLFPKRYQQIEKKNVHKPNRDVLIIATLQ